jgi:two-component system response regulator NreC
MEILIVEDHNAVIKGVECFIQTQWPSATIHSALNIQGCLHQLASNPKISLIITDLELSSGDWGIDLIKKVKHVYPLKKIIVHTKHDELSYLNQANKYGVDGYMLKTITEKDLIDCISDVIKHGPTVSTSERKIRSVSIKALSRINGTASEQFNRLTKTEKRVVFYAIQNISRNAIGAELNIGTETVKTHLKNINKKLEVKNRGELILFMKIHSHLTL